MFRRMSRLDLTSETSITVSGRKIGGTGLRFSLRWADWERPVEDGDGRVESGVEVLGSRDLGPRVFRRNRSYSFSVTFELF